METKINNFNGFDVRCVTQDDVVWFVAKDIVEAIGAAWNSVHSTKHIPEKWKGVYPIHTNGGIQKLVTITPEGAAYYLTRCLNPESKVILEWLKENNFIKDKEYLTIDKQYCFGRDIINNLFSGYEIKEEYYIDGYYLDWYIPELNLAIEFDEKYHENPKQKQKDTERENHITSKLGCKFLRYSCAK